jgi:hypothetical protein
MCFSKIATRISVGRLTVIRRQKQKLSATTASSARAWMVMARVPRRKAAGCRPAKITALGVLIDTGSSRRFAAFAPTHTLTRAERVQRVIDFLIRLAGRDRAANAVTGLAFEAGSCSAAVVVDEVRVSVVVGNLAFLRR